MIDIWLIFCLLVPFSFSLVQTGIECYREDEKKETIEKWTEAGKGQKVIFGFRCSLNLKFGIISECCDFQAKDVNKVGPEIKVVAANENMGAETKVQRSSFAILQTLQWAG